MAKTAAERKRLERLRKKAAGLVCVPVWIYPEKREVLKSFVRKLNNEKN